MTAPVFGPAILLTEHDRRTFDRSNLIWVNVWVADEGTSDEWHSIGYLQDSREAVRAERNPYGPHKKVVARYRFRIRPKRGKWEEMSQ